MTERIKILSIDPGINLCGIGVLELDKDGAISVIHAETLDTKKAINDLSYFVELHGEQYAKLLAIKNHINELLKEHLPSVVGTEIPFWNRKNPGAFEPLIMVVTTVANAVFSHTPSIPFERIPAASVKANLNVRGDSGDKTLVRAAIKLREINYNSIDLNNLGPDSVDAIAVGLYMCDALNNL